MINQGKPNIAQVLGKNYKPPRQKHQQSQKKSQNARSVDRKIPDRKTKQFLGNVKIVNNFL